MISYDELCKCANTGDILLFHNNKSLISRIIQSCSKSKYNHVAMIIKNPCDVLSKDFGKGLYVIETCINLISLNGSTRCFGTRVMPLKQIFAEYSTSLIYYRKIHFNRERKDIMDGLKNAYEECKDDVYDIDILDWIRAKILIDSQNFKVADRVCRCCLCCRGTSQNTDEFWCSSLIAFLLTSMGIVDKNTEWSYVSPEEFGTETSSLLHFKYFIEDELLIDENSLI